MMKLTPRKRQHRAFLQGQLQAFDIAIRLLKPTMKFSKFSELSHEIIGCYGDLLKERERVFELLRNFDASSR